jgi:hypothetical protein
LLGPVTAELVKLLPSVDWMLREEIGDILLAHYQTAKEMIAARVSNSHLRFDEVSDQTLNVLLRVRGRAIH